MIELNPDVHDGTFNSPSKVQGVAQNQCYQCLVSIRRTIFAVRSQNQIPNISGFVCETKY
jgi:hypothetical protein